MNQKKERIWFNEPGSHIFQISRFLANGVQLARDVIDSGAAMFKLREFASLPNSSAVGDSKID